jgi:hypothetical protein
VLDQLLITIPDSWQNKMVSYDVFNIGGSLMKAATNSNAGQTQTMDVGNLPVGTYILRATNGNNHAAQEFVKIR